MTPLNELNLEKIAEEAMVERGFLIDFPPEVIQEANAINSPEDSLASFRDMRATLWVSIDNDDSKDLDQLT